MMTSFLYDGFDAADNDEDGYITCTGWRDRTIGWKRGRGAFPSTTRGSRTPDEMMIMMVMMRMRMIIMMRMMLIFVQMIMMINVILSQILNLIISIMIMTISNTLSLMMLRNE